LAELRRLSQRVIDLNLGNILSADGRVRTSHSQARILLVALLAGGVAMASAWTLWVTRWIVRPGNSTEPQIDIIGELGDLLTADRIRVWDDPVTRDALFAGLVDLCLPDDDELRRWQILDQVKQREKKGSTFLAEGVALPHARIEGLEAPTAALGITRSGVLDDPMGATTEVVLLLLAPLNDPSGHLRRMAAVARVLRNRDIRRKLLRGDWRSQ
jgi:mannitol/fructose-specific phosphotransferase system IIA component (Ntr-type)